MFLIDSSVRLLLSGSFFYLGIQTSALDNLCLKANTADINLDIKTDYFEGFNWGVQLVD